MKEEIFREYDIRGIYPEALNEDVAYLVGKYFGEKAESKYVFVGRDARLSSQSLFESLSQGIIDGGARLVSLGEVPTPTLSFFNFMMESTFSIMITASHNPKEYNGFKMLYGNGESFSGKDIVELKKYVFSETIGHKVDENKYFHKFGLEGEYALNIMQDIEINPKLKIAWDLSNGVVSNIFQHLVRIMPNKNILLNDDIDGNFPAHPPDPTDHKNLEELKKYVVKENCDLGIALDGDADRVVFVTSKGNILLGDQTLLIFANEVISEDPNAYVIGDVKTSQIFYDEIKKIGGKTLMSKIGHSNVKSLINTHKAKFAGEVSGHYYFKDKFIGTDDGVYAALRMIEIISKKNTSLEKIYSDLPEFNSSNDMKIKIDDSKKFGLIKALKVKMLNMGRDFINIDGVRYQSENGWWLIRASNTEPAINVRYEGKTKEDMKLLEKDLKNILAEFGLSL
jgi:phosphomannomutase